MLIKPTVMHGTALAAHLALAMAFFSVRLDAQNLPLGPIGGEAEVVAGTGLVRVLTVQTGGPGAIAGLQAGDFIRGANGISFGMTNSDSGTGYVGAMQDLAMAIDRAEGATGTLTLNLTRSGVGGVNIAVNVGTAGSLGPAWPAGSSKAASIYEWGCGQVHSKVLASSDGNFGYNSGWFGMILLSHPNWNDTAGAKPYRNSINKLRTRCEAYLNGRVLQPAEAYYWNGSDVITNPSYVDGGLENWDICTSAMFLALYKIKTGDATTDPVIQRSAEAIAHRIQSWNQYDDPGIPHVLGGGIGRMGHGGVHGDYSHYNGTGALNIINAHALPALALLKSAGANMNLNLGRSINSYSYDTNPLTPTIEQKFRICWDYVKAATTYDGGGDDGNIGYVGRQSGWDSAGRTPGCLAGWKLYGMTPNTDDTDKTTRQSGYIARRWYRQQHSHAYTIGGVVLSQLSMPFLSDREERFFQENTRLYPVLSRQPNGSVAYFPGRQNNGGDSYLNYTNVGIINATMPGAIRSGNLPGFNTPNPARIHAWMRSPVNSWPVIDARKVTLNGGLSHSLDLDVTDSDGNVLTPAAYTAAWTHLSGPGTTVFGSTSALDTTVTFPQTGTYRVRLQIVRNGYTLTEPYDLVVTNDTPPAGVAPYVVTQPAGQSVDHGGTVVFTLDAQGSAPLLYQWRRNGVNVGSPQTEPQFTIESASAGSAGSYDCVITNANGTVTSAVANLTVNGVGSFHWGGLWRDFFAGISGSTVANLTGAPAYPNSPSASGVITTAESQTNYADNYGQRWSGWITPPQTGNYRFYIATDDYSELWLSTTNKRADRVRIAKETSYRGVRAWPTSTSDESVSASIALVAGQRYYIELLHKEGTGGDNAAVTWNWASPGVWTAPASGSAPLPGAILEYQTGGTLDDTAAPPANYPPLANNQARIVYGGAATSITLTGQDFENAPLTFTITENPAKGTLSGTVPNLTYTPTPGASGVDSFTFKTNDGSQDSLVATVSVTLVPESGADLKIWDGSADNLWTIGANWVGDTVPDSNDAVIFNNLSTSNLSTSLNGNQSTGRLVIENPAGAVTIANNTLTLSKGVEMRTATQDLTISSAVDLGNSQEWSIGSGRSLISSGSISGAGTLTKSGPGTLSLQTVSTLTGPVVVNGGTLELKGGGWYAGYVGGTGMLTVNQGATAINMVSHAFGSGSTPNRDLTVNRGRFRMQSESYVDDIFLTAGTIDNTSGASGDLRARSGSGTVITILEANDPSVMNCPFNLAGSALLEVADGPASPDFLISGPLTNSNTITKGGNGSVTLSGTSTHTGILNITLGSVAVTGSLSASSTVNLSGGSLLSGTGTLAGTVNNNNGRVSPGLAGSAVLHIGTFNQSSTASSVVELGGTSAGSGHDQLAVTGTATLAGVLDVVLIPSFTPTVGSSFSVLTCATRSGTFGTINLPILPSDRKWVTIHDPAGAPGLTLSVAAIPPFTQWQSAAFGGNAGNPLIAGELMDPDGDGIANLMEYALNLDPNSQPPGNYVSQYTGLPVIESAGNDIAVVYRRNLAASDLTYTIEETDDLGINDNWSPSTTTETTISDNGQTRVIRAVVPGGSGLRKFVRLRVNK